MGMAEIEKAENKKKWAIACSASDIPIFMQAAWLNAVCAHPNNWQVVYECDSNNVIIAALIIHLENKKFYTRLGAPHLTPHAGIWFKQTHFKHRYERYHYEKKVIASLIERIPKATFADIRLLPQNTDAQPFFWAGYSLGVRYTYQLEIENNREHLLKNMNDNTRRNVKKGEAVYNVCSDFSLGVFTNLLDASFNRQDKQSAVPKNIWQRLEQSEEITSERLLLFASDKATQLAEAAVYIVFDNQTAYYVAGGCTAEGRKNGALFFLLWQAILKVPTKVKKFDFEGSMIPTIEPIFRGFGGEQTPYVVVQKTKNPVWSLLESIK